MKQHAPFKTQQSSHGIHSRSQNYTIIDLLIYCSRLFFVQIVGKNAWDTKKNLINKCQLVKFR
jgi:hypothetical protein